MALGQACSVSRAGALADAYKDLRLCDLGKEICFSFVRTARFSRYRPTLWRGRPARAGRLGDPGLPVLLVKTSTRNYSMAPITSSLNVQKIVRVFAVFRS